MVARKPPLARGGGICEHCEQMTERLSMSLRSNLSVAFGDSSPFIRGAFGRCGGGGLRYPMGLLEDPRDCHASDVGHWLAMTRLFWVCIRCGGDGRTGSSAPTRMW